MIRFVMAAVWICAVTVGSIFVAFQASGEKSSRETAPGFFGGLDHVNTGIISVPVIKHGGVDGYFLSRLVYTVKADVRARLSVPAEALLMDQVYSYIYGNPHLDFSKRETLDLDLFRNSLRDSINERVGDKLVHEVLVEQLDYLSKSDIRDNTMRRRVSSNVPDRTN
jgi:hypothetical protein